MLSVEVNDALDAAICPYCNTAYIVEKAINNYTNNYSNNYIIDNATIINNTAPESDFVIHGGILKEYRGNDLDVAIPDSVIRIADGVFKEMNIRSVVIPDSVISIGKGVFQGCKYLEKVVISNNIEHIPTITFAGCTALTEIIIPGGVKNVMDDAFSHCTNLENVTISEGVKNIMDGAFSYCTALKSVTIPDSVTSIWKDAFKNCSSLSELVLPNENVKIDASFADCVNLTSITVRNGSTDVYFKSWSSSNTPWTAIRVIREERIKKGLCIFCGGKINFWSSKCKFCGKLNTLSQSEYRDLYMSVHASAAEEK